MPYTKARATVHMSIDKELKNPCAEIKIPCMNIYRPTSRSVFLPESGPYYDDGSVRYSDNYVKIQDRVIECFPVSSPLLLAGATYQYIGALKDKFVFWVMENYTPGVQYGNTSRRLVCK